MKTAQMNLAVTVNEIQRLIELKSTFIIEYFEWFREGLLCCIILEYCEVGCFI